MKLKHVQSFPEKIKSVLPDPLLLIMGLTMSKGNTVTICKEITVFSICMVSLCWVSMFILLPLLWIGIRYSRQLKNRKIRILYRFTCAQLFIAGTMFPIHFLFQFPFSGYCDNFTRIAFTASISLIAYYLSLIGIYTLYLIRFESLTQHTQSPHKSRCSTFIRQFLKFGIFAEIILFILVVWWDIEVYYYLGVKDRESMLFWWSLLIPTFLSFGIVNVFFNLVLLLVFLHRMSIISHTIYANDNESKIASIVEPVAVYTSSFIFVFFTTLTQTVYGALRGHLYINSNNVYMFQLLLINLDILTNCIALNAQFEPMQQMLREKHKRWYEMCCLCWVKKVSKQIQLNAMKQSKRKDSGSSNNKGNEEIWAIGDTTCDAYRVKATEEPWHPESTKATPCSAVTVTFVIDESKPIHKKQDTEPEFDSQLTTTSDLARGEFKRKYNVPPDTDQER
eukprot:828116_1